jgi:hypothetical protein
MDTFRCTWLLVYPFPDLYPMDVRTGVAMEMSALGGGAACDWVADAG